MVWNAYFASTVMVWKNDFEVKYIKIFKKKLLEIMKMVSCVCVRACTRTFASLYINFFSHVGYVSSPFKMVTLPT